MLGLGPISSAPISAITTGSASKDYVSWMGNELFITSTPGVYVSWMASENWVVVPTASLGGVVDWMGTEVFVADTGAVFTSQMALETWLTSSDNEQGVIAPKLGIENWIVPATWGAQIPKIGTEVFMAVDAANPNVFTTKIGSEVFVDDVGLGSVTLTKLAVEVWFPNIAGSDILNFKVGLQQPMFQRFLTLVDDPHRQITKRYDFSSFAIVSDDLNTIIWIT